MDNIWLKHYPPEVPQQVDIAPYDSILELLESALDKYTEQAAFSCMGQSLSFTQLNQLSLQFAAWLQGQGVVPGQRLALMLPNTLQYPICLFGGLRAGCAIVNCNPLYTATELTHQLQDSRAEIIVVLENFAHTVEKITEQTALKKMVVASVGELLNPFKGCLIDFSLRHIKKAIPNYDKKRFIRFKTTLNTANTQTYKPPKLQLDNTAFLQYTGGTTGISKGAELSHGNILANIQQIHAWVGYAIDQKKNEIVCMPLPLYHIFAMTCTLVFNTLGCNIVLIPNPKDLSGLVNTLKKQPPSVFFGVNTLFNGLLNDLRFSKLNFSQLKIALGGGMAVQQIVANRWKELTGVTLLQGYGLTETSPGVAICPANMESFNGSIGLPLPETEISIRDESGAECPINKAGEICVRGPQVMQGYWQRPQETSEVMTKDGFFKTGDIAYMNEQGYLFIVDRKKDMILVSGFNVYPNEIEEVISKHPAVLEVAAIGVPDERTGEAVRVFIVKKTSSPQITAAEITAYCRQELVAYKTPKQIEFRESLPKTNVGKILRRTLKEEALKEISLK